MTSNDKKPRTGGKPSSAKKSYQDKPRTQDVAAAAPETELKPERISKLLARAGVASRRDVERMIMEGRVRLNGSVLDTPVVNATFGDRIEVDGEPVRGPERTRLWLYHKPAGLVTTNSDPEGRPTVFDNLPAGLPRVMSIGRLDINTEGLLLLTNDGGLARVLELPTTGWLRRYRVRAHGSIDQARLDALKDGIAVEGVLYGAIEAVLDREQGHNVWITMGLREGKNREIKNVLGALGLDVNRLIRISYGPFQLGNLPEGEVQEVRGRMLRDQLGPRLIEDAGANFEAPIYDHEGEVLAEAEEAAPPRAIKPKREDKPSSWEKPGDRRERERGRYDTKPDFKAASGKPEKKGLERKTRSANVWMAPGARPVSEKKRNAGGAAKAGRPGGMRNKTPTDFRDGPAKSAVHKVRDEEGQWIRSSGVQKSEREDGFGGRGNRQEGRFADRPARGERGERGDHRSGDRSASERNERTERPKRDTGRPAKPFGDKPKRDSARPPRPFGAKSEGRSSDRPAGGKPFAGKCGAKPSGGKPFGGKSFGGKPAGSKPAGGRSGGGKPSGKTGGPRGADRRR